MAYRADIARTRALAALLAASALIATGCAGDQRSGLLPLPEPNLERLEPGVREELTRESQGVRDLAARATPSDREALGRAYGQLGRFYHAYELFDAAVPCYTNAISLLPGEAQWAYYLGHTLQSLHRLDDALTAFERALEVAPDNPNARLALARLHREERRPDEARRLGEEILEVDPAHAGALLLLAELAADREDPAEAIRHYERLLELQPAATRLHQPLAMAWRAQGDLERAREHLERRGDGPVRLQDPLLSEMHALASGVNRSIEQGIVAYRAGDYAGAVAAFTRAVEGDPALVLAHTNLGSALSRLGRYDEAAAQYRQVITLDPRHTLARFNLGVISVKQGRTEEGLRYYEEALAIDPTYRDARYNLANTLRGQSRLDEAIVHYRRVIDEEPGHVSARVGEVLCLLRQGQGGVARERLDEALVALPDQAALLDAAARIFAASEVEGVRDGTRALALAQRIVDAARTPRHLEALAMALAEVGRFDEAVAAQREAITGAETQGQTARLEPMRANLRAFERGEASRDPAV